MYYSDFIIKLKESIEHQEGSDSTQVTNTIGTYKTVGTKLKSLIPTDGKVLDYGAGLGLGSDALRETLHKDTEVHSYEPKPREWKAIGKLHYQNSDSIPDKHFDAVTSLNVLNVLEPKLRDTVTKDILNKVKVGGHVIIGVRGYKGDIDKVKNVIPSEHESGAVWVKKKGGNVYQKGFDGNELLQHLQKHGGDNWEFKKISGITKSGIIGRKVSDKPLKPKQLSMFESLENHN